MIEVMDYPLAHQAATSFAILLRISNPNTSSVFLSDAQGCVWKVEGFTQEQAEELLHALAREFDGDPAATDSTRVLRLPGFANKKYEEDFRVTVYSPAPGTYRPKDFKLRTEPVDSGPARWNKARNHAAASGPRELSQSERDWAYAKRALARGLAPEEIIHDIAEFRAHEKHDPEDYARRKVTKARAELDTGISSRLPSSSIENEENREPNH